MGRIIDADKLQAQVENIKSEYGDENDSLISQPEVLDLICEQPTVDAVPVVRCKYCMKRSNLLCPMAKLDRHYNIINDADDDGFCSYGLEYEDTV